ncbi:DUF4907 domain-containing protein [Chryseobacterium sp. JUb7]|uniref:DUF4907 domain-containing protein n=1 Tax=Chryseobacterium sp. JUb7 TaxID=2940599 RepID=UPI002169FEAB|nr:DUF4907 domain-containing protein [Chryseobacterium sp. JUb7]MCS3531823.1 hypothetical protein [Chryseobacterium sp. JUb7]
MTKTYLKIFFLSAVFLISCEKKNKDFDVKVTRQTSGGYGYQILKNKKILINQPYIPAIQGEKTFKNETDAHKTAELVMSKIHRYSLPKVSIHELDSMKIEY